MFAVGDPAYAGTADDRWSERLSDGVRRPHLRDSRLGSEIS